MTIYRSGCLLTLRQQKCYVSLVENLNIKDVECLKYSLSKGLGLGIVLGGSIMKIPQLLLSTFSLRIAIATYSCKIQF